MAVDLHEGAVVVDSSGSAPFDAELWFTTSGCEGRHYIVEWNPFTFHGRMMAWCPKQRVSYRFSKSAIATASDATRWWIRVYLAGDMPDPPRDEAGDLLSDDHRSMQRWRTAAELFLQSGYWYVSVDQRRCVTCGSEPLPSQPDPACDACAGGTAT